MAINFVIAFVGRSGSSYLQGLLDNHPDAQCLGEILWSFGVNSEHTSVAELLYNAVHISGKRASGFKFGNMHILKHPEVKEIMHDFHYRVIHLSRRNRVNQYISMRLAQLNGSWRSDQGDFHTDSFVVDFEHMDHYLDLIEQHDIYIEKYMSGFPTVRINYEDLVRPKGYYPLLDFLELEHMQLHSPFLKQRSGSQRDALENFDEVAAYYAGTSVYDHLDV